MMRPSGEVKVYLHREPIDMRTGRNGLAALVREGMQQDPFAAQALYVFIGRRFDSLKILGWDRNGYAIWQKKIESEESMAQRRKFLKTLAFLPGCLPAALIAEGGAKLPSGFGKCRH